MNDSIVALSVDFPYLEKSIVTAVLIHLFVQYNRKQIRCRYRVFRNTAILNEAVHGPDDFVSIEVPAGLDREVFPAEIIDYR